MSASRRVVDGPCIVLGGGITALGVVRSLGRAGRDLVVVAPHADLAARSRWVGRHVEDVVAPWSPKGAQPLT